MTAIHTATVEGIMAEVHILKVNNRQVTASMARQLDSVSYGEIIPMGRVRVATGTLVPRLELIGRHRVTGALVRAELGGTWLDRASADDGELIATLTQELPLLLMGGLR